MFQIVYIPARKRTRAQTVIPENDSIWPGGMIARITRPGPLLESSQGLGDEFVIAVTPAIAWKPPCVPVTAPPPLSNPIEIEPIGRTATPYRCGGFGIPCCTIKQHTDEPELRLLGVDRRPICEGEFERWTCKLAGDRISSLNAGPAPTSKDGPCKGRLSFFTH